ncbi:FkbM family methyltransferase [Maricaulis sp.]|uniref:FkbM family methyltransferase n=1 Tax=Maricaulis sp. TaxID=1486257 RepID=UPI0025C0FD08|nr:FkbM family methyltransferase [Maricaulis sp.]
MGAPERALSVVRFLSFKFDDGFMCGAERAAAILGDLPASFFLIGELLEDGPLKRSEPLFEGREFGNAERWRALLARGHEVQPHSYAHRPFDTLTEDECRSDLERSVKLVRDIASKANVFGFPFNRLASFPMEGLGLIAAGFETCSSDLPPSYHDLDNDIDLWNLKSWAVRESHFEHVAASLRELPDNTWTVLTFHSLDGEGHEPWSSEAFSELVNIVREQNFSVQTVGSMAFMLERGQAARKEAQATAKLRAESGNQFFMAPVERPFRSFKFLVNNPTDHIQGFHARGDIYEEEELDAICELAPGATSFLDVGANVGNHSIYLAHRLNLARVTPVEVQPGVLDLLKANLALNWHPSFDFSHLGFGLGKASSRAVIDTFNPDNLGGTSLRLFDNEAAPFSDKEGLQQVFRIEPGDNLFAPGDFDIVKIDVEGMELDVMRGMERFFKDFRGLLFVELRDDHTDECANYFQSNGWSILREFRRYQRCTNWYLTKD